MYLLLITSYFFLFKSTQLIYLDCSVLAYNTFKGLRCLNIYITNPNLYSYKELLEGIFNAVTTNESFIKLKFYFTLYVINFNYSY